MSGKLFIGKAEKIKANDAIRVQQEIIEKIREKYPNIEYLQLGSVGKKKQDDFNGDIDIGIKANTIEELSEIIHNVFDYTESVKSESYYIVSILYPYISENIQKFVSVDFIQVKDIEYTSFRYYCPDYKKNESRYKVGTKIMFVGMILNHCNCKDDNIPKGYYGKYSFLPTGLYRFIINKNNLKDFKEEFVTLDVDKIVHLIFNEKGSKEDFNSVETLWEALHSDKFKYPKNLQDIEIRFFVNSYRKCWEELVKPEDFNLSEETIEIINEQIKKEKLLRNINKLLSQV